MLDEASASLDPETDKLLQMSIREHFKHSTVLTIAHRLATIMDHDKVLVLDGGKLVEFESPAELVLNDKGVFRAMVHSAGEGAARSLLAMIKS